MEEVTRKRGRPKNSNGQKEPRQFVSLILDPKELEEITLLAKQIGITRSEFIRNAVKSYMNTAQCIAEAVAKERERCVKYWKQFLGK